MNGVMPDLAILQLPSLLEQVPLLNEAFSALEVPGPEVVGALEFPVVPNGEPPAIPDLSSNPVAECGPDLTTLAALAGADAQAPPDTVALVQPQPGQIKLIRRRGRGASSKSLGP